MSERAKLLSIDRDTVSNIVDRLLYYKYDNGNAFCIACSGDHYKVIDSMNKKLGK